MSRKKRYQPKDFESATVGNTFDTSANLYHSMLLHSAFQSLTSRQKALYLCMKDQYYCCKNHPNSDRLQFYFNWALANKVYKIYTNKNTFYNDIKVLVEKGFIKIIENNKNLITINDPCCGAGAMCIAAIDVLNENKVDYLNHAVVFANDIDKTCVYMTYLQLSFAGAAAIVEHKDTLMQETYDTFRTLGYIVQQTQNKNQM